MKKYLMVLGRQPELSVAELRAVFGEKSVEILGKKYAIVSAENFSNWQWLGGIIKVAEIISEPILSVLPKDGKVSLGLSSDIRSPRELQQIAMDIKKRRGSVRIIPNKTAELSSATVLHNGLYRGGNKFEFIITKKFTARTIFVQDIDAYTHRDRSKPARDAKNGMLPPKLAQILINLAAGKKTGVLLDPFCGSGTVLMEGLLREMEVYGTDINPEMIEQSKKNTDWILREKTAEKVIIEQGDATNFEWKKFDFIACETYLGVPYFRPPFDDELAENKENCEKIISDFLKNLHNQITKNTGIAIAVPCWFVRNRRHKLNLNLEKLGYKKTCDELIYHRPDQIVGREILVIKKK